MTNNHLEKVSDIFIQDLEFFGLRAPTIAWIGLGGCVLGSVIAIVYIVGTNNQKKKDVDYSVRQRAATAGVRG